MTAQTQQTRPRAWRAALATLALATSSLAGTVLAAPAGAASAPASGHRMFVTTHGHAGAAGTRADPLASVEEAVTRLPHGGTVLVAGGTYAQRVMLRGVHGVTIRPLGHSHVILDGGPLTPPSGTSAMVTIVNSSHIAVRGLDIRDYGTTSRKSVPIGIYVHGASSHVTIRHNHVHSMGNYNGTLGSFDINAHGIAVYGDRVHHPISDLAITHNQVDHLALGASETVVVNGNVDHWRITHNRIHDNNNIGIDAIGFEPTLRGAARYSQANRARHGVIADNVIDDIISRGNPAYYEGGGWCDCADGIYIDGGASIRVMRNRLRGDDIGIEVAAENARGRADHVVVADNFVTRSGYVGIATGGYCDGRRDCGGVETGRAMDNKFLHNTLYANNQLADGSPEILVQYHVTRTVIRGNIVDATGPAHALVGTVPRAQDDASGRAPRIDGNLYYASGGRASQASFGILGITYTGWQDYRSATGEDAHSRFADPRLRRPRHGDLHLRSGSPAVDAGLSEPPGLVGRRDIDGQPRVQGPRIDIGADEKR
jgi:Right handed beta helix region